MNNLTKQAQVLLELAREHDHELWFIDPASPGVVRWGDDMAGVICGIKAKYIIACSPQNLRPLLERLIELEEIADAGLTVAKAPYPKALPETQPFGSWAYN